jgi:hypothetical protein
MAKAQREIPKPQPEPETDDSLFGDAPSSEPVSADLPIELAEAQDVIPAGSIDESTVSVAPAGFKPFPIEPFPGRYGEPPYDHAPVQLTPDGERFMVAQWQVSRRWAGGDKRWEPIGFWAIRATGGKAITFKPTGWREHRD